MPTKKKARLQVGTPLPFLSTCFCEAMTHYLTLSELGVRLCMPCWRWCVVPLHRRAPSGLQHLCRHLHLLCPTYFMPYIFYATNIFYVTNMFYVFHVLCLTCFMSYMFHVSHLLFLTSFMCNANTGVPSPAAHLPPSTPLQPGVGVRQGGSKMLVQATGWEASIGMLIKAVGRRCRHSPFTLKTMATTMANAFDPPSFKPSHVLNQCLMQTGDLALQKACKTLVLLHVRASRHAFFILG